jgi:hypothetical protein
MLSSSSSFFFFFKVNCIKSKGKYGLDHNDKTSEDSTRRSLANIYRKKAKKKKKKEEEE